MNWKYVWDAAAGLPVILNETDSHQEVSGRGTDNTYVYGLDLISVTDRTGAQSYFLTDGLGSTSNLTDGSGTSTAAYSYDVFGALRSPEPNSKNEFRFTGEQRDPQTNRQFYYLRARYYDPATGRFLSRDPVPSGNLYAYVGNNPVNFTDPSGLCHENPLIILGGEKGRKYYVPVFTSKEERVGYETFGDCISAHECKLVLDRYCGSDCFLVCVSKLLRAFSSECAGGVAQVGITLVAISAAATGVGALVESGGVVLISVSSGATSATAAYYAAGPQNVQNILNFGPSGVYTVATKC